MPPRGHMRQDQAKPLILQEMRQRLPSVPFGDATGGFVEFLQLKGDRPDLFEWRSSADRWQVVHGWMLQAKLVTR